MDYRKQLTEDILPFRLEHAIDWKNGGIFTCLDEAGNIYGTEKSVWFQGRSLWTLSKAYNVIDKNPEYLKAARCIYGFLPKCTDRDGRMFFSVTEDGRSTRKRRYYYSEPFAAIGAPNTTVQAATCRHCARQEPKVLMKSVALRSYVQFA